jgi:hypothetical protein
MTRDRYRQLAFNGQIQVAAKFETDKDLALMRSYFSKVIFSIQFNFIGIL